MIGTDTPRENPSSMVDTPALSDGPSVPGSWSLSKISHAINSSASPSIPLFSPPLSTALVVRLPYGPVRLLDGDVLRDLGASDWGSRKSSGSYGCLAVRTRVEVLRDEVSTVAPVSCESSDERDVVPQNLPSACSVIRHRSFWSSSVILELIMEINVWKVSIVASKWVNWANTGLNLRSILFVESFRKRTCRRNRGQLPRV